MRTCEHNVGTSGGIKGGGFVSKRLQGLCSVELVHCFQTGCARAEGRKTR
jgi:hypothetical protein